MDKETTNVALPQGLIAEAQRMAEAGAGKDVADVIRRAMIQMDADRSALVEGIAAWKGGDVQDWAEVAAELRAKHGPKPSA